MGKFYIPEAWTGEQALAVQEFLEEIGTAIWNVHEKAILKAMNLEDPNRLISNINPHLPNEDEDFIPF
jgi:hypothetical protein